MNWKTLKSLLLISNIFSILLLSSCNRCNTKELEVLQAAREGDIVTIKKYFEDGGSPILSCFDGSSGGPLNFSEDDLYYVICKSESESLIKYYLEQELTEEIKNKMFYFFIEEKNKTFIQYFIEKKIGNNLIFFLAKNCSNIMSREIHYVLTENSFNFNYINPENGNTILMEYATCSGDTETEDLLELIKYFISIGVKTNIKNHEGKTAKELAVNQKVKDYLEILEKK